MSQRRPWGRLTPCWSVAGGGHGIMPASTAGLPFRRAWVGVRPPLKARGPSLGSVILKSPSAVKRQRLSLLRLKPLEVTELPPQLPPTGLLLATIVFLMLTVP